MSLFGFFTEVALRTGWWITYGLVRKGYRGACYLYYGPQPTREDQLLLTLEQQTAKLNRLEAMLDKK